MKYKFKMNVSEEDFSEFYKNFIFRSILKTSNIILYSIFLLFLLVSPIVSGDYGYLIYFFVFILIIGLLFLYMRRQGKRLYKNNPDAFNMSYTLTEKDITFQTEEGSSTKFWSEFFSIVEVEGYYFLYLKNKRGLIFVKNQMEEDAISYLVENSTKNMKEKNIKLLEK